MRFLLIVAVKEKSLHFQPYWLYCCGNLAGQLSEVSWGVLGSLNLWCISYMLFSHLSFRSDCLSSSLEGLLSSGPCYVFHLSFATLSFPRTPSCHVLLCLDHTSCKSLPHYPLSSACNFHSPHPRWECVRAAGHRVRSWGRVWAGGTQEGWHLLGDGSVCYRTRSLEKSVCPEEMRCKDCS